jgi:NAD(P)-dependent dehydrogenase (short-subunit alcohol dehydrogenase family)
MFLGAHLPILMRFNRNQNIIVLVQMFEVRYKSIGGGVLVMKKVAIVTASGRGIGASCARVLHERGYALSLLSPSGSAEVLAKQYDGLGVTGSVTSEEDLKKLVDETYKRFGRIDVVINNTGHVAKGDLLTLTDNEWFFGLEMMLFNVIRMSRLVVPIMQQRGGGSIVNISTAAAAEPNLKFPVSSVIRAGLGAFTKMFAERYARHQIRMNNILPGMVDSYPVSPDLLAKIPMGRYGLTAEIGTVAAFLASDDSSYMTGQSLLVDGGMVRSL